MISYLSRASTGEIPVIALLVSVLYAFPWNWLIEVSKYLFKIIMTI